ncbi:MAG TPA: Fic family protein [Candidatus Faecisoma merdavium]|nr:Fic family protein [Candidatus Faecisoma merdavium]
MKNKYQLTKEQNLFLAKKVLVSNIYNSARLEGINTTYPDTKTILEGINVPSLKLDEITCILNLRDAWNYVLTNIDSEINLDFICKVNSYVSRNESLEWGVLRNGTVGINGVDYIPDIPIKEDVINNIDKILKEENITTKAIDLMLYLMRSQIFWDGNKRTSMIIANKILIVNGCGVITVKEENINEFNILLTEYYNTNVKDKLVKFLYEKCIFGLEIGK